MTTSAQVWESHSRKLRPERPAPIGGAIHKPVELGYKAQVIDNADSVILDHTIGIRHPLYASQSQRRSNASPAPLEALDGQ